MALGPPPFGPLWPGSRSPVTFLVTVVSFGTSLIHLSQTPPLYGWNWDLLIQSQSGYGFIDLNHYRATLGAIPGVRAATAVSYDKLSVNGNDVSALGLDNLVGKVPLALDEGHMPTADNQVVLGSSTLASAHGVLGQKVRVSAAGSSVVDRVVGLATFPAIGRVDAQRTGLGDGIAMTGPGMTTVSPSSYPNAVLIDLAPGALGRSASATIYFRYNVGLNQVLRDQRSADIVDYESIDVALIVLAGVLGLVALAALAYTLAASTHSHRRDLAVLNALGFTRWQTMAAVLWQSSVVIGIALVVGIPMGVFFGRLLWSVFSNQVGAPIAAFVVPWVSLTIILLGIAFVADLVALAPAVSAARTKATSVLRAE
jgi:FtsX-like permease family